MWNKIYLVILAIAILATGVLLYLSYSWLQSIGAPANVRDNYLYYSNISWLFLLVSSLILLIAGNVVLWKTRRAWATWTTLLYFAVFMVAQTFWLENSFFRFKQENNFAAGAVSWSPVSGAVLIVLAAIIVFFDQYLVKRLLDKTYPATTPVESAPSESATDEQNV